MKIIGLILLGLLLLLLLLLLLPVRLRVQYNGALQVHAGLGPVCLQLYPRKKRQKEPKKPRERKEKPISDEKKAKKAKKQKKTEILPEKPSLQMILALIRLGLKAVGAMLRPISVPRLQLAVQVGVRRETIMRLEKAQYNPSLKLAVDISRAVEAPIEEIFIFPEDS